MGQSRSLQSVHTSDGWTVETIADRGPGCPGAQIHFYPLDRSQDVFTWDPV